jgi:hypothetical protein
MQEEAAVAIKAAVEQVDQVAAVQAAEAETLHHLDLKILAVAVEEAAITD